jgi:hypothetical protein
VLHLGRIAPARQDRHVYHEDADAMAKKISRATRKPAKPAQPQDQEDDLNVLYPERVVYFDDLAITVREYGHIEWLQMRPALRPMIDALAALLERGVAPTYEDALDVIAERLDQILPAICVACDIDTDTFDDLGPDKGETLIMAWWGVNGRFFVTRAMNQVSVARQTARLAQSAGASSTPPSSSTDTTPPASADTPAAS